jgi:hypothetical protein
MRRRGLKKRYGHGRFIGPRRMTLADAKHDLADAVMTGRTMGRR